MSNITKWHEAKHGVLTLGESRMVGVVHTISDSGATFTFTLDGESSVRMTLNAYDPFTFTPDAPKARLGMIVHNTGEGAGPGDELIRTRTGWALLSEVHGISPTGWTDEVLEGHFSHPIFAGTVDL